MKKRLWILLLLLAACLAGTVSASAVTNHTVKVGIKYGSNAMFSANLENAVGKGYDIGYYNSAREFVRLGSVDDTTVSVTASGTIYLASAGYSPTTGSTVLGPYHVQLSETYESYEDAAAEAARYEGGYPAYISDVFRVRIGCYTGSADAQAAMETLGVDGTVVSAGKTGVTLSVTKTTRVLFEFDCQGTKHLALLPRSSGEQAVTWFRFYKYYGGFEYRRSSGGNITVINVVDLEDYVKGVIPYEMSGSWPQAALEAQAICARTYVSHAARHSSSGFDVCNTTDCQVYYGRGSGSQVPTAISDAAVEATAGKCLYYYGSLIDAVYFSSDGGATESSENVWGGKTGYLIGKADPYEATITIPSYQYTVTYTPEQLTWVLQHSGYSIGTIKRVYVSKYTDVGNVREVTFVDTDGKTLTVTGSKCSSVFYSSTYNKSVRSLHFSIDDGGGDGGSYFVNNAATKLSGLSGVYCISGSGAVSQYSGSAPYVITSSGKKQLGGGSTGSGGVITITGTGYGHNVGMSQWGAYAMAKLGYTSEEILHFYYTDVTIK